MTPTRNAPESPDPNPEDREQELAPSPPPKRPALNSAFTIGVAIIATPIVIAIFILRLTS